MSRREVILATVLLLSAAAILHLTHYLIFQDAHHTIIYLFGDIAFLPIDILVLAVIVERVMSERERRAKEHKMNMVIGAFFSEVGHPLLRSLDHCIGRDEDTRSHLAIDNTWDDARFEQAARYVAGVKPDVEPTIEGLNRLRGMLTDQRPFMLGLLENPNLIEHETFTDCLWAIFHLVEELEARAGIQELPETDMRHLAGDLRRAYVGLLVQWVRYMQHLKRDYPYLYSFALRTNPFRDDVQVVFQG